MVRAVVLAIVFASIVGCSKEWPPVPGYGNPEDPASIVISIAATPFRAPSDGSVPVTIFVTVSDSTGLLLPGRTVELESSDPGDALEPPSGETRASGAFVSRLTGSTQGLRRVIAKVDGAAASVEVAFVESICAGDLLVGGQPPALARWPASHRALAILVGDLNGDGRDDAVVPMASEDPDEPAGYLLVRFGGERGPESQAIVPWGGSIESTALADFDGDGILDLAIAGAARQDKSDKTEGRLDLLLGNGDGTFRQGANLVDDRFRDVRIEAVVLGGEKAKLGVVGPAPLWNQLEDFRIDIVEAGDDAWQEVASHTALATGIKFADLDQDGRIDILIETDVGIESLLGKEGGSFFPERWVPSISVDYLGDVDGDGVPDLVFLDSSQLQVWRGAGDGSFEKWDRTSLSKYFSPLWLGVWDFDGDGVPDVLLETQGLVAELLVLPGDGTGKFGAPLEAGTMPLPGLWDFWAGIYGLNVGDFNGDGRPELAALGTTLLAAFAGDPGSPSTGFPAASDGQSSGTAFVTGRFNGDETLSVVVAHASLSLFEARRHDRLERTHGLEGKASIVSIAIKPDPDGVDDLILLRYTPGRATLSIASPIGQWESDVPFASEHLPTAVTSGDFDGDGRMDIAVLTEGSVFTLLANASGTFTQGATTSGVGGSAIATGDFDGDGRVDVVVMGDETVIHLGDGAGGFTPKARLPVQGSSVTVADLNRDGRSDVISNGREITVIVSAPAGEFTVARYDIGGPVASLAIGDLDDDFALDIAATGPGESLVILRGAGDGTFVAPVAYPAGAKLSGVAFGQFHRSRNNDLAIFRDDGGIHLLPVECPSSR